MIRALATVLLAATPAAAADAASDAAAKRPPVETGTLIRGVEPSSPVGTIGSLSGPSKQTTTSQIGDPVLAHARVVADCTVKANSQLVGAAILADTPSAYNASMTKLSGVLNKCALAVVDGNSGVKFQFKSYVLLDLLAEALLRRQGLPQLATLPDGMAGAKGSPFTPPEERLVVEGLTTCLAATKPELSEAVLWASPGSVEEKAAFTALAPYLSACVAPTAILKAGRSVLRLALATAIFRRTPTGVAKAAGGRGEGA